MISTLVGINFFSYQKKDRRSIMKIYNKHINIIAGSILLVIIFLTALIPHATAIFAIILLLIYGVYWWNNITININPQKIGNINPEYYKEQLKLSQFLVMKSDYLNSSTWKKKREKVIKREHYKCQLCSSRNNLEIHHLKGYNLIPNEPTSMLACLCTYCHKKEHEKHGYPQTYNEYMKWNTEL